MPKAAVRHRQADAPPSLGLDPATRTTSKPPRFVAPLGLASPQIRAHVLKKLSGLILALAFPIGLAASWLWTVLHEPELPLPFHIGVDQITTPTPARPSTADIKPLHVPLQDQAPAAGLARDPRLIENSIHGAVPRIASDGLKPRNVYARPFGDVSQPRISLIVTGLGLGLALTDRALAQLPPAVTLAFSPYGQDLVRQVQAARHDNRELLLQIPMEPYDFPANDAGPAMLAADAAADINNDRLLWSLARMTGYVGLTNLQGGRFRDSPAMQRFLEQVERRGLFYIDNGQGRAKNGGLRQAHVALDPLALDAGLAELETIAKARGVAIGIVVVTPALVDRLAAWSQELAARGIVLAPLSASIERAHLL